MKPFQPEATNLKPSLLASLGIIAVCTSFGANAVAIKISLSGLGVFTTAGIRFLIAGSAIAGWAAATGRPLRVNASQWKKLLILAAIFTCQLGLFYLGLSRTYASRGVLIANLQPFFVLILAHFFIPGDSINLKKSVGIVFGFSGVVVMFLEKEGVSYALRSGDALILAAVFLWAVNAVYTKTIIADFQPYQLVMVPGLLSVPFFGLAGWLWDDPMVRLLDWKIITSLAYQSLVTASFGFVLWTYMLRKYGAVTLHAYIFILPVAGVLFGGLILDEPVGTAAILLALGLIVAGILIVHSDFSSVRRRLGL